MRTLSACLKKEKHDVRLIFLPREFTEAYEENALNNVVEIAKGADLIGVSLMTNFFDNAVQVTQKLKSLNIPIVWGGIHPTIRPLECLNYVDIVCVGEGEEAVVELAKKMEQGQDYRNIQGLWFKDGNGIIKNKIRPLIQDLDSIPFQDYDYATHYILDGKNVVRMNKDLLKKYLHGRYLTIATRGCPFGCAYCCNNTLNRMHPDQNPMRKRSISNIIEELTQIKTNLSPIIKYVTFEDDSFLNYSTEEIKDFCKRYKEKIGLPLNVGGISPLTLTREKLSFLVDAGLKFMRMGIQTGSERTKKLYKRYHSNDQVEKAARIINEFKHKVKSPQYDVIMDNPWETDDDLIETLMFLAKLPTPYHFGLFSLVFYPETELYEKAKKDGIITDDLRDVYRKHLHNCQNTYLNKLFFLLDRCASVRVRILPPIMFLLTNRISRRLRLNWPLYAALYAISALGIKTQRLKSFLQTKFSYTN
jgi:radical SAM superfamily enzyme YgiQ (UPF0313 family)